MAENDFADHELFKETAPSPEPAQVDETPEEQPRDDAGRFSSDVEEPADEAESVEASSEDEGEPEEPQADEPESDDDEPKEEKSQRRRSARERISQLTAQRKDAEARAEQAERQFRELQEYLQSQVDPNLEFEDPAKYTQESVRRALAEQRAHDSQVEYQRSQEQRLESTKSMFMERVQDMRDELDPEFEDKFSKVPCSDVAAEFLAESDIGPRVANHLGRNPSMAHHIANLPPAKQLVELARLEGKLMTPPPKRTTKAPPPTKAIQATGPAGGFDPGRSGVDDFKRMIYGKGAN